MIELTYPNQSGIVKSIVNNRKVNANILQEIKTQFNVIGWDDLRFPLTPGRQGALQKPNFDYTNLGLLFPNNDATEIAYIIAQFQHTRKNGSDIHPHMHWIQSQETFVTWKMDYRWYENGTSPPGSWTTLITNTGIFTYPGSGSILQISEFDTIDGSSINSVSSMMDIRVYRDDSDVAGDVLAKEFDIHFQKDNKGSSTEDEK